MNNTATPTAPGHWPFYHQAVVDIRLGNRTLRVTPCPSGTATGSFPEPSGRTIHVITACNPGGSTAPAEDNDRAQGMLTDELVRRHVSWWPATGGDAAGVHVEQSAAVVGMSDTEAREVGRRFGQDAVFAWTLNSWRLLSCSSEATSVYGWRTTTQWRIGE